MNDIELQAVVTREIETGEMVYVRGIGEIYDNIVLDRTMLDYDVIGDFDFDGEAKDIINDYHFLVSNDNHRELLFDKEIDRWLKSYNIPEEEGCIYLRANTDKEKIELDSNNLSIELRWNPIDRSFLNRMSKRLTKFKIKSFDFDIKKIHLTKDEFENLIG